MHFIRFAMRVSRLTRNEILNFAINCDGKFNLANRKSSHYLRLFALAKKPIYIQQRSLIPSRNFLFLMSFDSRSRFKGTL